MLKLHLFDKIITKIFAYNDLCN